MAYTYNIITVTVYSIFMFIYEKFDDIVYSQSM